MLQAVRHFWFLERWQIPSRKKMSYECKDSICFIMTAFVKSFWEKVNKRIKCVLLWFVFNKYIKSNSLSYGCTGERRLAGRAREQTLPRCQSAICIVLLWHFKHLECTLCFEASSFPQEEITNQRKNSCGLRLARGICDCRVASLTLSSTWEYLSWGRGRRNSSCIDCCWSVHM